MSRAVWFTEPRTAVLQDDPVREPGSREVTVKAAYSLVSQGSEMHVFRGDGGLPDEFIPTMEGSFGFPVKFAYQTVGTVVAVGQDAGFAVGDRVFCTHPHQELFTLPIDFVELIDERLDMRRAVFAGMFRVATNCHLDAPVRIGEVVVVTGLGLIGTFAAFLARRSALKVILVDTQESRRRRADWIGADAVVAPVDAPAAISEMSDGRGADVFIETSGSGAALQLAVDQTAQEGVIAVPAWYGVNQVGLRLSPEFHLRRLRVVSSWVGVVGSGLQPRWNRSRLSATASHYLREVDIDSIISHEIPFEDAPVAYKLIDEGVEDTLGVLLVHDHAS